MFVQNEAYQHIGTVDMEKVEKCVRETMEWMNNAMNAQAKQQLNQNLAVYTHEIKAQRSVSISYFTFLLEYPILFPLVIFTLFGWHTLLRQLAGDLDF